MTNIITTPNEIQSGEVTHHQDQSMSFVSLRIKNTMNTTAGTPIPLPELRDTLYCFILLPHDLTIQWNISDSHRGNQLDMDNLPRVVPDKM